MLRPYSTDGRYDEEAAEADRENAPQRRQRSSDVLLRTLRERQEREPEPPPDQA